MQDYPLTVDKFINHAARQFPECGVIGIDDHGQQARRSYVSLRDRANRLSGAFLAVGLETGDRVATLAWNSPEHFELYFATMGAGLVCHTLNPRFSEDHLVTIVNEAGDRLLAVSPDLLGQAQRIAAQCPTVESILVLPGGQEPLQTAAGVTINDYEEFLALHGAQSDWGGFDERSGAGLCYTSGTTSDPKGVLYTHRSNYLHTLRALQADALAIDARDTLLLAVPMFHANGWGIPFAAPAVGCSLILPGRKLDGASLCRAIVDNDATIAVGVQTLWLSLADHVEDNGLTLPSLGRILIGGSSCPPALLKRLERILDVEIQTSWGMTELSPIGTIAPAGSTGVGSGKPVMGLELLLTDADGRPLAEQVGREGHLRVRGASVIDRYYGSAISALDERGFFNTGDLAVIAADGSVTISGRSKDLIKSGGEWINPTELEQLAGSHPSVRHVAVIGRDDNKWGERPVMIVEADPDDRSVSSGIFDLLRGRVADWWLPDSIELVEEMPLAATGKVDKRLLRSRFGNDRSRAAS